MKILPGIIALCVASTLASAKPLPHYTKSIHGGKKGWWTAVASYPTFNAHSAVLNLGSAELKSNAAKLVAGFLKEAPGFLMDNAKPDYAFEFDSSFAISYASQTLLSLNLSNYESVGAAHPNITLEAFNFGLVHGKPKHLDLQDLFKPDVKAASELSDLLMKALRKMHLSFIEDGTVKELTAMQFNNFVITTKGLSYMFSAYEVASYAEGPQFVDLSFKQLQGLDPNGPLKGIWKR